MPALSPWANPSDAQNNKACLALFVCFVIKCTHLKLVSDFLSDSFLGALKRFVSRRGKPSCIYSDNGLRRYSKTAQVSCFFAHRVSSIRHKSLPTRA